MKKKKYLPLYERLIKSGRLHYGSGLCHEFKRDGLDWQELREIFEPPQSIDRHISHFFWGSGSNQKELCGVLTPMRQNIVLLMAALNGEL